MARFIPDEATGLYYDTKVGKYFDPQAGKYIEPEAPQTPVPQQGSQGNSTTDLLSDAYDVYDRGDTGLDIYSAATAADATPITEAMVLDGVSPTVAAGTGGQLTVAAGSAVPEGYIAIGTAVDGGTMVAPVTGGAGTTGGIYSAAAPYLGPVLLASGLYGFATDERVQYSRNYGEGAKYGAAVGAGGAMTAGAIAGTEAGIWGGPYGALIGAAVGAALGAAGVSLGGSGKTADAVARDYMRGALQEYGLVDGAYSLTLANGEKFGIGKEDRAELKNQGTTNTLNDDKDINQSVALGTRAAYQTDATREDTGATIGRLDPLADILVTGNAKRRAELTGYMANAAQSSGDIDANINKFYSDAGIDADSAYNATTLLYNEGKIDKDRAQAYYAAIDNQFGVAPGTTRPDRNVAMLSDEELTTKQEFKQDQKLEDRRLYQDYQDLRQYDDGEFGRYRSFDDYKLQQRQKQTETLPLMRT